MNSSIPLFEMEVLVKITRIIKCISDINPKNLKAIFQRLAMMADVSSGEGAIKCVMD